MKFTLSFSILFVFVVQAQSVDPLLVKLSDQQSQRVWVDSVYHSLSLEEKIGQLFMPMVFTEKDSLHYLETLKLVEEQKVGGLIFSLGGPVVQSHWLNKFQAQANTPLLIAMDAEWGPSPRTNS